VGRVVAAAATDALGVTVAASAKALIAKEGFDPVYGARPIKRTIQKRILDPLAQKLLSGEFREGDTVVADAQNGEIVFWSEQYAAEIAEEREKKPVGAGKLN